jgi:hypothetical protein
MTLAISGHGTIVARAPSATPTTFTDIAELKDISLPGFMRNEFDATTQNRNIDAYVLGVLRREPVTLALNFLSTNATHDHLTGLYKAMITEPPPRDGYKFTLPDGMVWVLSGQVQHIAPKAPVDGLLSADVTIRMSDVMSIGGITVGT